MDCNNCDGIGYEPTTTHLCLKCRGTGKAASALDVTNVGVFQCHMCGDRNTKDQNLQPCNLKIGVLLSLVCYLCKECQIKLTNVVKNYVRVPAGPQSEGGLDRSIIV